MNRAEVEASQLDGSQRAEEVEREGDSLPSASLESSLLSRVLLSDLLSSHLSRSASIASLRSLRLTMVIQINVGFLDLISGFQGSQILVLPVSSHVC